MGSRSTAARARLWFGALWLVAGAPFLVVGVHGLAVRAATAHALATAGESVVGTVIDKYNKKRDRDSQQRKYSITFRYVTQDGRRLQSAAEVDADTWYSLTELGPIAVRYVRDHPEQRSIPGEPDTLFLYVIHGALGGLFSLIGALLVAFNVAPALRRTPQSKPRAAPRAAAAVTVADAPQAAAHGNAPAPAPRAPRHVPSSKPEPIGVLRRAWRSGVFLFGLPFAAFGILALVFAARAGTRELQYRFDARHAIGSVIDKLIRHAGSQGVTASQYLVRYRFTAADGTTQYGSRTIPFADWEPLRSGAPLQVDYLPARPYESRLAGTSDRAELIGWGVVGVVFGSIGGALLLFPLRRARLVEGLLRDGSDAEGTVTQVAPSSVTVKGTRMWRVRYEFRDGRGALVTGQSGFLTPKAARVCKKGDVGPVRFDPADPRRSIWLECL